MERKILFKRLLVFGLLSIMLLIMNSGLVHAQSIDVYTTSDFCRAFENAGPGDTIIIHPNVEYSISSCNNYWQVDVMARGVKIMGASGEEMPVIKDGVLRIWADGVQVEGLKFQNADIWIFGYKGVVIDRNIFVDGSIWLEGAVMFTITKNNFTGGGIRFDFDLINTTEFNGVVTDNYAEGKRIVYIEGSSGSVTGDVGQVIVVRGGHVTISNAVIYGKMSEPILFYASSDSTINRISLAHQDTIGYGRVISIINSTGITIEGLDLHFQRQLGRLIYIYGGGGHTIKNVHVSDTGDTTFGTKYVYIWYADGVTIEDNTFINGTSIYTSDSSNILITGNTLQSEPYSKAIYIEARYSPVNNIMITNNIIDNTPGMGCGQSAKIEVYVVKGQRINNMVVRNNRIEITSACNKPHSMVDFTGLIVSRINGLLIEDNIFRNLTVGIEGPSSCNGSVVGNTFEKIESFAIYGLSVSSNNNVTVARNVFEEIRGKAIDGVASGTLRIYLNIFRGVPSYMPWYVDLEGSSVRNETFLSPEPVSYTYNGRKFTSVVGNYWDSYSGEDKNGDGIGDTPFYLWYICCTYPTIKIYDLKPLVDPSIVTSVGGAGGAGGQPSSGGGAKKHGFHAPQPVQLPPEKRKAFERGRKVAIHVTQLLENHTITSPQDLKQTFDKLNITQTMEELRDKGVIATMIHYPPQERDNLRRLLESIYGPMLINYPSPLGRLYLLYTLYYSE